MATPAQAYDKFVSQDATRSQTPFMSQVGKEAALGAGGTVNLIRGVFSGNADMTKRGLKDTGKSVLSAVTGAPLRALNAAPPKQYVGGSADALAQRYGQYGAGTEQGAAYQAQGVGQQLAGIQQLQDASGLAAQNYGLGLGLINQGLGQGQQAQAQQAAAIQGLRNAANVGIGSVAENQMRAGIKQIGDQNIGAAGGDPLAMRDAMFANANQGLAANAQFAALRAQEAQAQQQAQMNAEAMIGNMYGQNAQLGYGLQGLGLSNAQGAAGQYGQFGATQGQLGLGLGNLGLGGQQLYTGAQVDTDRMQLDADTKAASAGQAAKGGIMGVAGRIIGGVMGGGG